MAGSVEVVFLGTSGAVPQPRRFVSSILVRDWNGFSILLDAGEGAQLRLMEAGGSPMDIDAIFITHSHGDHINGVAGLLQSMAVLGRRKPLWIVGHRSVTEFVQEVLEVQGSRLGFEVKYTTISDLALRGATRVYARGGDQLLLGWFKTCHTRDSYGFILEWNLRPRIDREKLRSLSREDARNVVEAIKNSPPATRLRIVYTGDTAPCQTVVDASMGADLLIHEASFDSSLSEEAHEKRHSTARDAASAAAVAGANMLVLAHLSTRYRGFEARRLLVEARSIHSNTMIAYDLMRLRLTPPTLVVDPTRILDALSQSEEQASR